MLDFIFVMAPFVLAWWLTGWPGKSNPAAVKAAGWSFVLFGISMLLRLVVLGRRLPAHKYSDQLMTTWGSLGFCVFMIVAGGVVLLVHSYFANKA